VLIYYIVVGFICHTSKAFLSVCLSVRLSVKRVHCDKTKDSCANILIPYERTLILVFRHDVGFACVLSKLWQAIMLRLKSCA